MENGYCFVGDLLGFKNIILNLPPECQTKRIEEWIGFVQDSFKKFDLTHSELVSDTIFAETDLTKNGLKNLIGLSKCLLQEGIKLNFPIRSDYIVRRTNLERKSNFWKSCN